MINANAYVPEILLPGLLDYNEQDSSDVSQFAEEIIQDDTKSGFPLLSTIIEAIKNWSVMNFSLESQDFTHMDDIEEIKRNLLISQIASFIYNNAIAIENEDVLSQIIENNLIEVLGGTIPIVRKYFAEASLSLDYNEDLNTVFLIVNLPDNGVPEEEFMRIAEEDFKKYKKFLREYFTYFKDPNFTVSIRHV